MESTIGITMAADPDAVFRLAAAVEDWPRILPHYRRVRLLADVPPRRIVEMAAWRDFYPVRWTAVVEPRPDERVLRFIHVDGPTRGMEVEWRLTPAAGGTRVQIWHRYQSRVPLIGPLFAEYIANRIFIRNIAGKTLRAMKRVAERQPAAGSPQSGAPAARG
jgi:ribosome-associated toxin RatA of RatAB toxin-antitoxin module